MNVLCSDWSEPIKETVAPISIDHPESEKNGDTLVLPSEAISSDHSNAIYSDENCNDISSKFLSSKNSFIEDSCASREELLKPDQISMKESVSCVLDSLLEKVTKVQAIKASSCSNNENTVKQENNALPGKKCAAKHCSNNQQQNPEFEFYSFPSDYKRCKQWIGSAKRSDLMIKKASEVHKNHYLCSYHFEPNMYIIKDGFKILKSSSLPTLFEWVKLRNKKFKRRSRRRLKARKSNHISASGRRVEDLIPEKNVKTNGNNLAENLPSKSNIGSIMISPLKLKITPVKNMSPVKKIGVVPVTSEVLKPFQYGWRRELVIRGTNDGSPGGKRQGDVYYFNPEGKKLRSMPQVLSYLDRIKDENLSGSNFTFSKQRIFKEPEEIIRNARDQNTMSKTIVRTPVQKDVNSNENKNVGMPRHSLPNKRKIKPINRDFPLEEKSSCDSIPKGKLEVNEPVMKKPRGIKITPKLNVNLNNSLNNLPEKAPSSQNENIEKIDKYVTSELNVEEMEPLCSLNCPGRNNAVPSLLCCVCLCLFHPECVNFNASSSKSLICKRCLQGITEGKTKAPVSAKETLVSLLFPDCVKNLNENDTTNGNASKSLPLSVANALSLKSTFIQQNSKCSSPTTKSSNVFPNVSLPLSLQKNSIFQQSAVVLSENSNSSDKTKPVDSASNVFSSCIPGTLIFTKPINPVSNCNTISPVLKPVNSSFSIQQHTNDQTKLSSSVAPPLNVSVGDSADTNDISSIRPNNTHVSTSSTNISLPLTNFSSPNIPGTNVRLNSPILATGNKYFLHMIPDAAVGMRYVLSPSQTTVQTIAAPPLPAVYTSNSTSTLQANVDSTQVLSNPLCMNGTNSTEHGYSSDKCNSTAAANFDGTSNFITLNSNKILSSPNDFAIETTSKKNVIYRHLKQCSFDILQSGYISIMHIFQYLPVKDLLRCRQVCKTWQNIASQPNFWNNVSLKNLAVTDWQKCASFLTKRSVNGLNLSEMKSDDEDCMMRNFLSTLRYLGDLKRLNLNKVTASVLLALADQLTNLEVLTVNDICDNTNTNLGDPCYLDVGKFQRILHLKELHLHSTSGICLPKFSSDTRFSSFKVLQNLEILKITSFKELLSDDVTFLAHLPSITELEIGDCSNFDSIAYEAIGSLSKLKKLRLEVTEECDEEISECIMKLANLTDLGLILTQITPCIANSFGNLEKLERLTLWPSNEKREYSYTNIHKVLPKLRSLLKLQWGIVVNDSELTNSKDKVLPEESNINNVNIRIPFLEKHNSALTVQTVDTKTLLHSLRMALPSTIVNIMFAPCAVAYRVSRMSLL